MSSLWKSSRKESPYYQGSMAVATGWGNTIEGGSTSDVSILSIVTEMRHISKRINLPVLARLATGKIQHFSTKLMEYLN